MTAAEGSPSCSFRLCTLERRISYGADADSDVGTVSFSFGQALKMRRRGHQTAWHSSARRSFVLNYWLALGGASIRKFSEHLRSRGLGNAEVYKS
jgi:hypothetical protein